MKKWLLLAMLFASCLIFVSCGQDAGKSDHTEMTIGESTQFSQEEMNAAIYAVKSKFKSFTNCELLRLSYDEASSISMAQGYVEEGRSSAEDNVIVFYSDFYVSPEGGVDGGLQPDHTYHNWAWILKRDSKNDSWKVNNWGLG